MSSTAFTHICAASSIAPATAHRGGATSASARITAPVDAIIAWPKRIRHHDQRAHAERDADHAERAPRAARRLPDDQQHRTEQRRAHVASRRDQRAPHRSVAPAANDSPLPSG